MKKIGKKIWEMACDDSDYSESELSEEDYLPHSLRSRLRFN